MELEVESSGEEPGFEPLRWEVGRVGVGSLAVSPRFLFLIRRPPYFWYSLVGLRPSGVAAFLVALVVGWLGLGGLWALWGWW